MNFRGGQFNPPFYGGLGRGGGAGALGGAQDSRGGASLATHWTETLSRSFVSLSSCILIPKGAGQPPQPAPTEAGTGAPRFLTPLTQRPCGTGIRITAVSPGGDQEPGRLRVFPEPPGNWRKGEFGGRGLVGNTGPRDERPGPGSGGPGKTPLDTRPPHMRRP